VFARHPESPPLQRVQKRDEIRLVERPSARYRFVVQQIIVIAVRVDDLVAERAYGWIVSEITVLVIAWL
jgi:hypothetical protein